MLVFNHLAVLAEEVPVASTVLDKGILDHLPVKVVEVVTAIRTLNKAFVVLGLDTSQLTWQELLRRGSKVVVLHHRQP